MTDIKITDVRTCSGDSAFLIDDGKTSVLCDTGFAFTGYALSENISGVLGDRNLDYIFLTHSHYDHVLGTPYILRRYPGAKVIAGHHAADVFRREGARRVMRELDGKFAAKCGITEYEFLADELRVDVAVGEGDVIRAGNMNFEVLMLPGHTRCSLGFFLREKELLLAPETLGVYDGNKVITPSFLVGYKMTMESIERVLAMKISRILSPHYGLLTEAQTRFFLGNMRRVSEEAAEWMKECIAAGTRNEDIITEFKKRYRKGELADAYPEDAVNLNTSIMIDLVRRELLDNQ